jgi:HemY protein
MTRTLFFLAKLAVLVAVAVWLANQQGPVSIEWRGYVIETTAGLLIAAMLVAAGLVALAYRIWRALRGAPRRVVEGRRSRRRRRGYQALTLGMVAVAAGDAREARRQARRADALLEEPPLTMLLAAQTAQLDGDEAAAEKYFTAMLDRPEPAFLGLRGLLVQADKAGDRRQALELAERANRLGPTMPWVLETLFDLQVQDTRWRDAQLTLDRMAQHKLLAKPDARRRQAVLLAARADAALAAGDRDEALRCAREAHKLAPALLAATLVLARLLAEDGHQRGARRVIEDGWRHMPHPQLAAAHAALEADEAPLDRFKRLARLHQLNPDHRESHLAMAEAALAANLWGEARKHLDAAGGAAPSARICRLMAEVEEAETEDAAAARRWLRRAGEAEPDPAWLCGRGPDPSELAEPEPVKTLESGEPTPRA